MKKALLTLLALSTAALANAKTLIVYYSYTNNVHQIATDLQDQTGADILRVEPAEEGVQYDANGYAIGSALIAAIRSNPNDASSYPAIKETNVDLSAYDTFLIGTPLWWSNMAAPMQTFLFQHGAEMAGKNIGLIVSSASSGISDVVADAKRLIPNGKFLEPNLWIRSSQTSNRHSLVASWLTNINYSTIAALPAVEADGEQGGTVRYDLAGRRLTSQPAKGLYVERRSDGTARKVVRR